MTLANETTLSLVRAGVNPFELVNTDRRRMIGNFEATNTKKRIQKLKKEKQVGFWDTIFVLILFF